MMPPPIIGLREPCANTGAAASSSNHADATIELMNPVLLNTALFLIPNLILAKQLLACAPLVIGRRFLVLWFSHRTAASTRALRKHWQSPLNKQVHGPINRNVRHASLFIDPSIAIELDFLVH